MGDALSDSSLLSMCEQFGDSEATLRFALGTTSFPRSSAIPPPPPTNDQQPLARLRSGDLQIRDLHSFDGLGGYEASDEGSAKRGGSHSGKCELLIGLNHCGLYALILKTFIQKDIPSMLGETSRIPLPLHHSRCQDTEEAVHPHYLIMRAHLVLSHLHLRHDLPARYHKSHHHPEVVIPGRPPIRIRHKACSHPQQ